MSLISKRDQGLIESAIQRLNKDLRPAKLPRWKRMALLDEAKNDIIMAIADLKKRGYHSYDFAFMYHQELDYLHLFEYTYTYGERFR